MSMFLYNNDVITEEVIIQMISNTDKVLHTRSGMKNNYHVIYVFVCLCVWCVHSCMYVIRVRMSVFI